MFFNKKNSNGNKCSNCGSTTNKNYSFCPNCGKNLSKKDKTDYGLLGENDFDETIEQPVNLGITDKLVNSIFNSMMKNLDKQFRTQLGDFEKDLENTEIKTFPNGIRIKITGPKNAQPKRPKTKPAVQPAIEPERIEEIKSFPREKAKTSVKRLADKIIYELKTPGVSSTNDVFVSKLESGYEVKVIGNKKVYVNNIPINLPIKKYTIQKNKLSVEFLAQEE